MAKSAKRLVPGKIRWCAEVKIIGGSGRSSMASQTPGLNTALRGGEVRKNKKEFRRSPD